MVLHWIANPGLSGLPGSIPGAGVRNQIMPETYQPAEDSYLLSEVLKKEVPKLLEKNPEMKSLEIGSGSGINLKTALKGGMKKRNILGTDINPLAVEHCKKLGFNCVESDLFENIKKRQFDLIVFNPPYLPLDKKEPKSSRLETTGGKKGNEIVIRFLEKAKEYLSENGIIFLITSSLSEDINFEELGYVSKILGSKKLFFEGLFVWELMEK